MSKLRYLLLIAVLLVAAWSKAITTTSPTLQIDSLLHQSDYVRNALGKETYISLVAASGVSLAQKPDVKKVVKQVTRSIFNKVDHKGKKVLTYYGLMFAGAMARTAAATAVHPLNVCKTMLQTKGGVLPALTWSALSRGAGSQFIMSIPHGAINFAVTETTKTQLASLAANSTLLPKLVPKGLINPLLDFTSSAVSTFICSIVSTPQMVLTDRIMAGVYPNFFSAVISIAQTQGWRGFYLGWLPSIVQKIPSYALTWMFFQQLKLAFFALNGRAGTSIENTLIGSFAAAGACTVMIPVDTIKTRIVTQPFGAGVVPHYTGMVDCFVKILKHEGVGAFYKSLPPRLAAVVPMIGIQFSVYELMKRILLNEPPPVLHKAKVESRASPTKK